MHEVRNYSLIKQTICYMDLEVSVMDTKQYGFMMVFKDSNALQSNCLPKGQTITTQMHFDKDEEFSWEAYG